MQLETLQQDRAAARVPGGCSWMRDGSAHMGSYDRLKGKTFHWETEVVQSCAAWTSWMWACRTWRRSLPAALSRLLPAPSSDETTAEPGP